MAITAPAPTDRQLTNLDRCDRCGAQAFVAATFPPAGAELLFCAHHWSHHENRAAGTALHVLDERDRLLNT